jgi:tetratricopeptide (TPR) repeat protein
LGVTWDANIPRVVLGWLALYQGDNATAQTYLNEALAIAEQSGDSQGITMAHFKLAENEVLYGQSAAAISRLHQLIDLIPDSVQSPFNPLPLLAEAYLAVGESDRANELAVRALDQAAAEDNRLSQVNALRVRGMVLRERGEWAEADASFASSAALARAMPWPFAEACTLLEWGRLAQQCGDQTAARDYLEDAQAIFLRLGARPLVARTEQALAGIGAAPSG